MSKAGYLHIYLAFISILFAWQNASAQQTKVFSEAKGSGKDQAAYQYERWSFILGEDTYEIKMSGKATRKDGKGRSTNFRIVLDEGEELSRVVYYAQYRGDLLVICEISAGGNGRGSISRIDGRNLKTTWQSNISGFNIARGLIENNSVYLAASGFVGKINLETGKYIWEHDNLYRKYVESGAFNAFFTPKIIDSIVVFEEEDILNKGFDHRIHVNKSSGNIVKVILN